MSIGCSGHVQDGIRSCTIGHLKQAFEMLNRSTYMQKHDARSFNQQAFLSYEDDHIMEPPRSFVHVEVDCFTHLQRQQIGGSLMSMHGNYLVSRILFSRTCQDEKPLRSLQVPEHEHVGQYRERSTMDELQEASADSCIHLNS